MDNSNRLSGAIDAFAVSDAEAGLAHLFDAYLVSTHWTADLEALRKTTELMYILGKREQAQNSFFRTTRSSVYKTGGMQSQPAVQPLDNSQFQQNQFRPDYGQGIDRESSFQQYFQDTDVHWYTYVDGNRNARKKQWRGMYSPQPGSRPLPPPISRMQAQGFGRGRGWNRGFLTPFQGGFRGGGRGGFESRGRGQWSNCQRNQPPVLDLPPISIPNPPNPPDQGSK
jgi:hypothetical protein